MSCTGWQWIDNILRLKFKPPESELDRELFLNEIVPRDHEWNRKLKKYVQKQIEDSSIINVIPGAGPSELANQVSKNVAWQFWLSKIEMEEAQTAIKDDFFRGFHRWLMGVGDLEDIQKTPWGKKQVKDPEVIAYLSSFIDAKYDFLHAMQRLCAKAMMGILEGIYEHYLFFKYIVRGGWAHEGAGFLDDWQMWLHHSNRIELYNDLDEAIKGFDEEGNTAFNIKMQMDALTTTPEQIEDDLNDLLAIEKLKADLKEEDAMDAKKMKYRRDHGGVEPTDAQAEAEQVVPDDDINKTVVLYDWLVNEKETYELPDIYTVNEWRMENDMPELSEEDYKNLELLMGEIEAKRKEMKKRQKQLNKNKPKKEYLRIKNTDEDKDMGVKNTKLPVNNDELQLDEEDFEHIVVPPESDVVVVPEKSEQEKKRRIRRLLSTFKRGT